MDAINGRPRVGEFSAKKKVATSEIAFACICTMGIRAWVILEFDCQRCVDFVFDR